jgi:hypothetical protein|tara:strand:+ start:32 stop:1393 length:1362 start_codon:yes stop_codon:yes gene_type:complete
MGLLDDTLKKDYYEGNNHGNYQFTSLDDIITQFQIAYVGGDKIISKVKRSDIVFHAHRAMQELSFDTFKSCKALEITVPETLQMILPQDYVNYTRIAWVDNAGIKHSLYPTKHTQNPLSYYQNEDGEFKINPIGTLTDNSNVVVLDGDYSDILVHGMRVISPNLKPASYIHLVTTTAGITSITLKNKDGTSDKDAILTTNERLEITRFEYLGYGLKLANNSLIETTTTAAAVIGDTQLNLTSVVGIEEGMLINHPAFVNDNSIEEGLSAITVVGVGSSTIELSHAAVAAVGSGDAVGFISNNNSSTTWSNYKSAVSSENQSQYNDDAYWPMSGSRYGLDPQHAQANGSFYIDCGSGKIHFSSNFAGKTVVLDYISDSLGTDEEMQVHKFAEEAMYKWIAHAILSTKANIQEYIVNRLKRERFAAIRTAKLRLSNLKIEEITQIMRGKSKQIKH